MQLNLDLKSIQSEVVKQAVYHVIDNDDKIYQRIREGVEARIDKLFAERVEREVSIIIQKIIEEGFDRTFQDVDQFGTRIGDPTTIRKRLGVLVKDYWSARVDKNGKTSDSSYRTITRAEYVLVCALGDDFAKEFKQQAVNVAAEIKDGLREQLRSWVDTTLGELFHVKSETDKKENRSR